MLGFFKNARPRSRLIEITPYIAVCSDREHFMFGFFKKAAPAEKMALGFTDCRRGGLCGPPYRQYYSDGVRPFEVADHTAHDIGRITRNLERIAALLEKQSKRR
jgi:hypothetical protein